MSEWLWLVTKDAVCSKVPSSNVETDLCFYGFKTKESCNEGTFQMHWSEPKVGGLAKQGSLSCRHQISPSNMLVEDKPFVFSASWDCDPQFSHNI